jgi:hypothetical protein
MPRCRGQSGQTLPFVALALVVLGAASLVVGRLGGAAVARARAVAAADASALAGAVGGRADAEAVARANGGRVVGFGRLGDDARVRVGVGEAEASARARPVRADGTDGAGGLAPALRAAVARAEQLVGRRIPVTSGRRSMAEQAALWANRFRNPFPVAPPGRSKHEHGLAIDVPASFLPTLLPVARSAGLCRPYPNDPVHFELCPP